MSRSSSAYVRERPARGRRVARGLALLLAVPAALVGPALTVAPARAAAPAPSSQPSASQPSASQPSAPQPSAGRGQSTDPGSYVTTVPGAGCFPLVARRRAAPIVVSGRDYAGVRRVVADLRDDVRRVTGLAPPVSTDRVPRGDAVVLVGTLGHSPLIDRLVAARKLDVRGIAGRWETSLEQVVDHPLVGVRRALVIAGSDQRGTIYGVYDVSRGIGVSPWYFWDDVRPAHHDALYVTPGRHTQGTPAVKYRGFFINDENPQLGRWATRFFGPGKAPGHPDGFNAKFYAKVFETMLRLKANYLWPAVWGRAFAEDDPANHATATEYGVVMGTSHEAPMMRGIEEWNRHAVPAVRDAHGKIVKPGHDPYGGTGEWSFRLNRKAIEAYWREGIQRMVDQHIEGVVTLGMRGNGDVGLPDGESIDLMKDIIATQRKIIAEVTHKDVRTIPQVWTLYKEVQRYWDKGLRVPDDVIVNFTDDNWSNLRRLPSPTEKHSGGYGLYYHFDYVGVGRDYKWVDTANLANVWDQLHQTYAYGDSSLWVTNVGDLKGNELPTQFFLDYAWSPNRWPANHLREWEQRYAAENFGTTRARAIADVLHTYGQLQARRKPELLNRKITVDSTKPITDPSTIVYDDKASPFSLTDYRELDRATAQWQRLAAAERRIRAVLPSRLQDAWFELVGYEVRATANLYALRDAEFTNILYARQGRALTNHLAALTEARFADDLKLADHFNHGVAGGKWNGFQTQPHIDYGDVARYGPDAPWQQPQINNDAIPDVIFPAVQRITLPAKAELGVAIDGSDAWWPAASTPARLPTFSPYQTQPAQYIDVFNRGTTSFTYRIRPGASWLRVFPSAGRAHEQVRATVRVDWSRAPKGTTHVPITVTGAGRTVFVQAVVHNPRTARGQVRGFVEANGYVSMDVDHFSRDVAAGGVTWKRIPDIGRTDSGMEPFPVTAPSRTAGAGPRLEYRMTLFTAGRVRVNAYLSPRNDVFPGHGLRYAVSIDDELPQVVDITAATGADATALNMQWARNTSDNVNVTVTTHVVARPGVHVLKVWMIDPTVVVQKLVVDTGGLRPSYLGPPESRCA